MEYLMTYGWAILIIAVVLGTLFQLGVFSSTNFAPRAPPGSCRVVRLAGAVNLEGVCSGVLPQYTAQFSGVGNPTYPYIYMAQGGFSPTAPFSISVWFKPTAPSSSTFAAMFQYVPINDAGRNDIDIAWISGSPNILDVEFWNGGACVGCPQVSVPSSFLNSWHNVVLTYSGIPTNVVIVYLDGTQQVLTGATQSQNAQGNLYIGGVGAQFWSYIGNEANVQVYNSVLTMNDIQALYYKGIGGAPIYPQYIIGWWPLNGDANDYGGNNDNGAPTSVIYTASWLNGYTPP